MIPLDHVIGLSAILFTIGVTGVAPWKPSRMGVTSTLTMSPSVSTRSPSGMP